MESWGDVHWTLDNGWYLFPDSAPVLYPHPAGGAFVFAVYRRKGNARWVLRWRDSANYLLFELDKNAFHRKQASGGTIRELATIHRQTMEKMMTIKIEVSNRSVKHSVWANGDWSLLDNWEDPTGDFTGGKFGFWPASRQGIGISNFKFTGVSPGKLPG